MVLVQAHFRVTHNILWPFSVASLSLETLCSVSVFHELKVYKLFISQSVPQLSDVSSWLASGCVFGRTFTEGTCAPLSASYLEALDVCSLLAMLPQFTRLRGCATGSSLRMLLLFLRSWIRIWWRDTLRLWKYPPSQNFHSLLRASIDEFLNPLCLFVVILL